MTGVLTKDQDTEERACEDAGEEAQSSHFWYFVMQANTIIFQITKLNDHLNQGLAQKPKMVFIFLKSYKNKHVGQRYLWSAKLSIYQVMLISTIKNTRGDPTRNQKPVKNTYIHSTGRELDFEILLVFCETHIPFFLVTKRGAGLA